MNASNEIPVYICMLGERFKQGLSFVMFLRHSPYLLLEIRHMTCDLFINAHQIT